MVAAIAEAVEDSAGKGRKVTVEQVSCDFTKENFAAKPDLSAPGADDVPEKEFCDNCGKEMVLKNGPWGPFMSCPDYSADPPCRTIRKLTQKVQQKPPVQLEEACPKCGKPLLQRDGQYGEFIACSGYPKCKYVKQELLEVPCPKDGGDIAVRKTRRGDTFYGCVNYPKCDFASNLKLVNQVCPKCDSAYLLEVCEREGDLPGVPEQPGGAAEAAHAEGRAGGGGADHAGVQLPEEGRAAEVGGGSGAGRCLTRRRRVRWCRAWPNNSQR